MALIGANLIVFRAHIANHFTRLWGDRFDGGIEASILEHWFNVLRGLSAWSQTNAFYPHRLTLGYNDGYFLYGLIHAFYRVIGFDVFVASALVDITVKSVGFLFFTIMMRRLLASPLAYALLGATVFSLGHAMYIHAFHQQLLSLAFAPAMVVLVADAVSALLRDRPGRFLAAGAASVLFYGAWLLTAFYMAWFFGLFAGATALAAVFCGGLPFYRRVAGACFRYKWQTGALLLLLAASVAPFLAVYLPKAAETGMHGWDVALNFAPRPNDAVNLGAGHFLFGRLYNTLCAFCTRGNYEVLMGSPPILLYLFVVGGVWALVARRGANPVLLRAAVIAAAVTWLMLFRFHNTSLWWLIYEVVPGAKGVRVISRYEIFLTLPVVAAVMAYLAGIAGPVPKAVMALLGGLLVLEQLGTTPSLNDRAEELARIAAPKPPAACAVFYVTGARGQDTSSDFMTRYPHNVEAMLIAERVNLPTINGYSSFLPPGWDFENPLRDDYLDRVHRYAARFGVRSLCRLDLQTLQWSGPEPDPA